VLPFREEENFILFISFLLFVISVLSLPSFLPLPLQSSCFADKVGELGEGREPKGAKGAYLKQSLAKAGEGESLL